MIKRYWNKGKVISYQCKPQSMKQEKGFENKNFVKNIFLMIICGLNPFSLDRRFYFSEDRSWVGFFYENLILQILPDSVYRIFFQLNNLECSFITVEKPPEGNISNNDNLVVLFKNFFWDKTCTKSSVIPYLPCTITIKSREVRCQIRISV